MLSAITRRLDVGSLTLSSVRDNPSRELEYTQRDYLLKLRQNLEGGHPIGLTGERGAIPHGIYRLNATRPSGVGQTIVMISLLECIRANSEVCRPLIGGLNPYLWQQRFRCCAAPGDDENYVYAIALL